MSPPPDFRARARAGWGEPPDWIAALADACQRDTQVAVALRLDVSGSQISQVLAGKYPSALHGLEAKVRGAIMGATVTCPVLSDIGRDRCMSEQGKPFSTASSISVRLHRACRAGCPHSRLKGGHA
ncbi:transcriptional regulator [Azorhizobium sp. AG788]|uniref:transcriptional regulator n=1 Tax=Azorhizobium sp. AG788 TaxID=2183897 RepID=UPI00313A0FD1